MTAEEQAASGKIIVISGPGGAGKGTVVDAVLAHDEQFVVSRSWTTRAQRPGEADDAYNFVTTDEFEAAIAEGAFLEYDHHFGNYYGSPVPSGDDSRDLVLEIDVNGARHIHENKHANLLVLNDTPSEELQEVRYLSRCDEPEKVADRLAGGAVERELAKELPYVHVINDELESCAQQVLDVVADYRSASES